MLQGAFLRDKISPLTKALNSSFSSNMFVVFCDPYNDDALKFLTDSAIFPSEEYQSTACPALSEQSSRQMIAMYFLLITKNTFSSIIIHQRIKEK